MNKLETLNSEMLRFENAKQERCSEPKGLNGETFSGKRTLLNVLKDSGKQSFVSDRAAIYSTASNDLRPYKLPIFNSIKSIKSIQL